MIEKNTMKQLIINYLLEEHKYVSKQNKELAEKQLKRVPEQRLFDMLLEKARSQRQEQALKYYQEFPYSIGRKED